MLKFNICSDVKKYIYLNNVLMKFFTTVAINLKTKWQKRQITAISY